MSTVPPYAFHPRERRRLSPAEEAQILATCEQHLARNRPAFIDKGASKDPMSIALAEIRAGVCPVCVVRFDVDGVPRVPPLRKPEYGNGGLWM